MSDLFHASEAHSENSHPGRSALDEVFRNALRSKVFSGAALVVATPGRVLLNQTWGATELHGEPVDARTLFDLASLTKPLATASECLKAIGGKLFDLDDSLARFFPASLLPRDKRSITIRHLLSHCSGLPPYEPFYLELIELPDLDARRDFLLSRILEARLLSPPGKSCHYSDLGFLLLGMIVQASTGSPLDRLFLDRIEGDAQSSPPEAGIGFCPIKVGTNAATPPERHTPPHLSFAATEQCPWRGRLIVGEVHDENCYTLGGVAGHAGLFGTALGVFRALSPLWDLYRGAATGPLCPPELVRTFWARQNLVPGSTWALGFDTPSAQNSSAGDRFSPRSVGHLGFTGTSFWLDLDREILIVLLTNRVYPSRDSHKIKELRPLVHNLVMEHCHELSRH